MENGKVGGGGGDKPISANISTVEPEEQNPNSTGEEVVVASPLRQSSRTPFTNLSQVDADLALARTLQEQERAYMMLAMNNEESDYGSWETGSYLHEGDFDDPNDGNDIDDDDDDEDDDEGEYGGTDVDDGDGDDDDEDAFDVHAHDDFTEVDNPSVEIDPSAFSDDEAYARALQDAEERDMAARLLALAGISDLEVADVENHGGNSQETWEEVDPDELSYEELIALGEVVGTESRGLSAATIASLVSENYKAQNNQDGSNDSCVICRLDYEDGDTLTSLSCKHSYHSECINNWLQINKVCPVCNAEVSTSENR